MLDDRALEVDEVGGVERVGLVIGEGAIGSEIQRDDLQRQGASPAAVPSTAGTVRPGHSVGGIDDDLQGRMPLRSTSPRRNVP